MIQAPITRQEVQDVPLGQIEAKLAQLWREADAVTLAAGGQIISRNSVMTLVVIARGDEQSNYVARAIEGLTGQHPSRSIILALHPEEALGSISASVSIHSHSPNYGASQVRAEQIMIHVRGNATQHIPSVVLPLLLTEMPTFVWWTGSLPNDSGIKALLEASDRSIIDSADFTDTEQELSYLIDLINDQGNPHVSRSAFSDFNWTRIRAWRELTAQFFDAPRFRSYLEGVERVEIEFASDNANKPNATQAYLYAGWLASRLKWKTYTNMHTSTGAVRLGMHTNLGSPITVEITPRQGVATRDWWATSSAEWPMELGDGQLHPAVPNEPTMGYVSNGALMRINIQSRLNGKTATFTILREDDLKSATTIVVCDGETVPQRRTPLDSNGETALLHQQLSSFDHNNVFEDAIVATKSMIVNDSSKIGRSR